jgi:hypothetical protein
LADVTKLLLTLILSGALANGIAKSQSEPPLLIDSPPSHASLDANN